MTPENQYIVCPCNVCTGHIEFPSEGVGRVVECPHCNAATILYKPEKTPLYKRYLNELVDTWSSNQDKSEAPTAQISCTQGEPTRNTRRKRIDAARLPPLIKGSTTKKCPFCAEVIQIEAIKCKHCGEFLNIRRAPQNATPRVNALRAPESREWFDLPWTPFLIGAGIILMLILFLDLPGLRTDEIPERASQRDAAPITRKRHVTADEFSGRWPLTVKEGDVYSRRLPAVAGQYPQIVAVFKSGDTEYGLNGTALQRGYRDINTIRVREVLLGVVREDTILMYKDINELITLALENENPPSASP